MEATRFVQPMNYYGTYRTNSWAGYVFKEALGYSSGIHTGVDYNGAGGGNSDANMPSLSIANGVVRYVGNLTSSGYGNTVIIEHPLPAATASELGTTSLFSRYMHLNRVDVSVGQQLSVGQQMGLVGNTGTTYAHLHLDLWKANLGVHLRYDKDTALESYLDPFEFIESHKTEVIGGSTVDTIKSMYWRLLGREADQGGIDTYSSLATSKGWQFVYTDLKNSAEGQADWERRNPQRVAALEQQLASVQQALANEQAKPPKEVIKEVEKIVEKTVEVVKEVPVYTHDAETKENVNAILKLLKSVWGSLTSLHKKVKK